MPPDSGVIFGITDYEQWFIGICIMDKGRFGIDCVASDINLVSINDRVRAIGDLIEPNLAMSIAEINIYDGDGL